MGLLRVLCYKRKGQVAIDYRKGKELVYGNTYHHPNREKLARWMMRKKLPGKRAF
jgi:hypothetical protein